MSHPQDFVEDSKEYGSCIARCIHGVWAPRSTTKNDCCSICCTPLAARGLTKREVMAEALKTADVRIKKILKVKEEELVREQTTTNQETAETEDGAQAEAPMDSRGSVPSNSRVAPPEGEAGEP